jgi:hypothetical protein
MRIWMPIFVAIFTSSAAFAGQDPALYFKNALELQPGDIAHSKVTDVRLSAGGTWDSIVNGLASVDDYMETSGPLSVPYGYPLEIDQDGRTYSCKGLIARLNGGDVNDRLVSIEGCDNAPYPIGFVHGKIVNLNRPSFGMPNMCNEYKTPCDMPEDVRKLCMEGITVTCRGN